MALPFLRNVPVCVCGAGGCEQEPKWPERKTSSLEQSRHGSPSLYHHFRGMCMRSPSLRASKFQHKFGFLTFPSTEEEYLVQLAELYATHEETR